MQTDLGVLSTLPCSHGALSPCSVRINAPTERGGYSRRRFFRRPLKRSQAPLTHIRLSVYVFEMKKRERNEALGLFRTLSDPTRLRLLNLLDCGETCVCELTGTLRIVQPMVSRHLAQLKRAGLVEAQRQGKWIHYRWAEHGNPLVRHVLIGLRQWMVKHDAMSGERRRRRKVCCQIKLRKPREKRKR
jgi:ArsR family transcriptional regulator